MPTFQAMATVFIGNGDVTRHELQRWYRPVYPGVYAPKGHNFSLRDRTVGAWLWSRRRAVIAGIAASALHGAQWIDDDTPIELIWSSTRPPRGLVARDETLGDDEITHVAALPVTTPVRTAYDLGRLLLAKRYGGARGIRRLRAVLPLVDAGAASPKETWLRLLLIDAGLPVPTSQIPVIDRYRTVAVLDMGWEDFKVAVEYDGDHHRSDRGQYVRDQWRLRKLAELGWIIIRVISEDRSDEVVVRVRNALPAWGTSRLRGKDVQP
jgi:hypothetical protein